MKYKQYSISSFNKLYAKKIITKLCYVQTVEWTRPNFLFLFQVGPGLVYFFNSGWI